MITKHLVIDETWPSCPAAAQTEIYKGEIIGTMKTPFEVDSLCFSCSYFSKLILSRLISASSLR